MSPVGLWEAIHRHENVCDGILMDLVADLQTGNQQAQEQADGDVPKKLCAELMRLSRALADGEVVFSPVPTHAEFAARISTDCEAVTRTLSALERGRNITRRPPGIALTDPASLRRDLARKIET